MPKKWMRPAAGALVILGLSNAAVGNLVSGLIVAASGVLLILRATYWPNYPRRKP